MILAVLSLTLRQCDEAQMMIGAVHNEDRLEQRMVLEVSLISGGLINERAVQRRS